MSNTKHESLESSLNSLIGIPIVTQIILEKKLFAGISKDLEKMVDI